MALRTHPARPLRARALGLAALAALGLTPALDAQGVNAVIDVGLQTRFQDLFGGHHKRGRALVAADFNLDGRVDFYSGNPGDESFVLENRVRPDGGAIFVVAQVLLVDELAWGAAAADYDNDGDYDLLVTAGGNEGEGFNYLFRNLWIESGSLAFVDVTDQAGVKGPIPPGESEPVVARNANAVWGDYDRDGDVDVFVSVNGQAPPPSDQGEGATPVPGSDDCGAAAPPPSRGTDLVDVGRPRHQEGWQEGRNTLWSNNDDGTFTDVTEAAGLGSTFRPTRHSTWFDADNDGDLDLYENNFGDFNVLWRNLLAETGSAVFEDATADLSLPGENLQYPNGSFVSCSADFNQDGWEDLIVFKRGLLEQEFYPGGHVLFLNQAGAGFYNAAEIADLNHPYQPDEGVMGAMIGDVNADGVPDVYVGNGGVPHGQHDQLYLSDSLLGAPPHYRNRSDAIDFPAAQRPGVIYPPYPYRTHGTAFVDVDNDGILEIAVSNGGPAAKSDEVREPNRLFKLGLINPADYLKIRPVGDGTAVSRDAIGTRLALTVSQGGGAPWTLYRTLFAGSCFSAQNGFQLHFYLAGADTIHQLAITWPDGQTQIVDQGLTPNSAIVVERSGDSVSVRPDRQ